MKDVILTKEGFFPFFYIISMFSKKMKRHLEIKNVGPIKAVSFDINGISVFIGPQGAGKSTIAKIISFCYWIEKKALLHQGLAFMPLDFFKEHLVKFHKLDKYISQDSVIKYTSDIVCFEYKNELLNASLGLSFDEAVPGKISYIPSERNIVTIPETSTIAFPNNCLRNYIFEWFNIRNKYSPKQEMKIADLGVSYYFDSATKKDVLVLEDDKKIELHESSSGMQSVVPLYVLLDYLTKWIYENKEDISFEKMNIITSSLAEKFRMSADDSNRFVSEVGEEEYKKIWELMEAIVKLPPSTTKEKKIDSVLDEYISLRDKLSRSHFSNIIIEEPELNLFPKTQTTLVYDILKAIDMDRDSLVVTTHSPYILYALNNCMQAWLAEKNCPDAVDEMKSELSFTKESFVNPQMVSVWEIQDGEFRSYGGVKNCTIQDDDGLIRKNYFDSVMQNVMADFSMLGSLY